MITSVNGTIRTKCPTHTSHRRSVIATIVAVSASLLLSIKTRAATRTRAPTWESSRSVASATTITVGCVPESVIDVINWAYGKGLQGPVPKTTAAAVPTTAATAIATAAVATTKVATPTKPR
ncbi:hypothetical protein HanPI659440_Chr03g0103581 [Helianthus annuus]|nr:hypothetical protein HanPI659440_Chr03g0103581 [Helianthus annuus]